MAARPRLLRNFVNGQYVDPDSDATADIVSPVTAQVVATAPVSSASDVVRGVLEGRAAADLFATPTQALMRVTLPLVAPGIAAGALLAFSLSFDDYIITNFNASPSSVTFPMFVWGAARRGTPVQINVIGTVMFLAALLLVASGQLISNRRARAAD